MKAFRLSGFALFALVLFAWFNFTPPPHARNTFPRRVTCKNIPLQA